MEVGCSCGLGIRDLEDELNTRQLSAGIEKF